MNRYRKWLALPTLWLAAASLSAAPIPSRATNSQGPISDALSLRGLVPTTPAPAVKKVVMPDDATIVVHHRVQQAVAVQEAVNVTKYVPVVKEVVVKKEGRDVKTTITENVPVVEQVMVTKMVMVPTDKVQKESLTAKSCKFFRVSKEGKLESLEAADAAKHMKQPTSVLTGHSADIDLRHLELIKPGTLYVVLPITNTPVPVPVPQPPQERLEKPKD
jgi:hypothetical protein